MKTIKIWIVKEYFVSRLGTQFHGEMIFLSKEPAQEHAEFETPEHCFSRLFEMEIQETEHGGTMNAVKFLGHYGPEAILEELKYSLA